MQKQHFRLHNLVATIVPTCPRTSVCCASGTCCGPPSAAVAFDCYFSLLLPESAQLAPDDLRTIVREMRSKLKVEKRGLDVVLTTDSDEVAVEWRKVLEDEGLRHVEDVASTA